MTLKFNTIRAVLKGHVPAKFYQGERSGSSVIVLTETKKTPRKTIQSVATARTATSNVDNQEFFCARCVVVWRGAVHCGPPSTAHQVNNIVYTAAQKLLRHSHCLNA